MIGTGDTDSSTNTTIVLSGTDRASFNGQIDYVARSTGSHIFYTTASATERMRIASNGNIGIGTNNPSGKLHVVGNTRLNGIVGIQGTDDSQNYIIRNNFMTSGSLVIGNMNQDYGGGNGENANMACLMFECANNTEIMVHDFGQAYASIMRYTSLNQITMGRQTGTGVCSVFKGNNGTAWDQTSDHRIKENIKKANLNICYDNVKNINLYRFNYKDAFGNGTHRDRTQLGFVAQQVNIYYPKSITRGKRKLDDNREVPDLASIDVSQVNFTLFGAVKQLIRVVEKQSNRIKKLEEMLNIVEDGTVENDADEPYVKIVCEGEVDIDTIVPSEPEETPENTSSSNTTSNVF
jgi:hypothetical protein